MIETLLREFWTARYAQDIEQALLLAAKIRDQSHGSSASLRWELIAIEASLLRARGEILLAEKLIAQTESQLVKEGISFPSTFLMEKGLNAAYRQDFNAALEYFLLLSSRNLESTEPALSAIARMNAMICCEYLNLPAQKQKQVLVTLLSEPAVQKVTGLLRQADAYDLRVRLQQGTFNGLETFSADQWDQATYHALYFKSLPMLSKDLLPEWSLEKAIEGNSYLYLKAFRLRTLTGHQHTDDLQVPKLSDWTDRIYLWTWQWLDSSHFSFEKLLHLIEAFSSRLKSQPLTPMSLKMLVLALKWLILFEPALESRLRPMLLTAEGLLAHSQGATHSSLFPFFEIEESVQNTLQELFTGRSSSESLELLKRHPLWNSEYICYRDLFFGVNAQGLLGLRRRIHEKQKSLESEKNALIIVRMDTMEAIRQDGKSSFVSTPGCLALRLLLERATVSCAEFLWIAFEQKGYEPQLHESKIANLLTRLRLWLPGELRIQKRGNLIRRSGPWEAVSVSGQVLPKKLATAAESLGSAEQRPGRPRNLSLVMQEIGKLREMGLEEFDRKDLENKLRKSRATTNRLLVRWIRDGIVRPKGRGKLTRYSLVQHWRSL